MTQIWAKSALLPTGWADDVSITVDPQGRIDTVTPNSAARGHIAGLLLPAPVNVHSHAFQRAMAGLTERRGPDPSDSFWTWRQLMYRFLDQLTPDHIQAIATLVQMEMLEAGYACNAEFHYLHHQPGGQSYDDISEMAQRVMAASELSGIGLCLLPVHYEFGGCDGRTLTTGQNRFGNTFEQFQHLCAQARAGLTHLPPDAGFGVAPHSLRAVCAADLRLYAQRFPDGPIHMHLAEQKAEVSEVQAHWGARPVQWALDNMELGARWCLIHCTQMTPDETRQLAKTKAVAGLCPITESSLGDGIFAGTDWVKAGGRLALGSDSNIRISLAEELRTLDYSQRLRDNSRAPFATPDRSSARRLFDAACEGGAQASGRMSGALTAGHWADMVSLDMDALPLWRRDRDTALDSWVFSSDDQLVQDVWSAGRHMVREGRHIHRADIVEGYRTALSDLRDQL